MSSVSQVHPPPKRYNRPQPEPTVSRQSEVLEHPSARAKQPSVRHPRAESSKRPCAIAATTHSSGARSAQASCSPQSISFGRDSDACTAPAPAAATASERGAAQPASSDPFPTTATATSAMARYGIHLPARDATPARASAKARSARALRANASLRRSRKAAADAAPRWCQTHTLPLQPAAEQVCAPRPPVDSRRWSPRASTEAASVFAQLACAFPLDATAGNESDSGEGSADNDGSEADFCLGGGCGFSALGDDSGEDGASASDDDAADGSEAGEAPDEAFAQHDAAWLHRSSERSGRGGRTPERASSCDEALHADPQRTRSRGALRSSTGQHGARSGSGADAEQRQRGGSASGSRSSKAASFASAGSRDGSHASFATVASGTGSFLSARSGSIASIASFAPRSGSCVSNLSLPTPATPAAAAACAPSPLAVQLFGTPATLPAAVAASPLAQLCHGARAGCAFRAKAAAQTDGATDVVACARSLEGADAAEQAALAVGDSPVDASDALPSYAQSELAQAMSDMSQQDTLHNVGIEAAAPSAAETAAADEQEDSLLPHAHAIVSAQPLEAEGNHVRTPVTLQYARSSPVQPGASRQSPTSVASRSSCEADRNSLLASAQAAYVPEHSADAAPLALQPLLGTSPTFSASQQQTHMQDSPHAGPFGSTPVRAIASSDSAEAPESRGGWLPAWQRQQAARSCSQAQCSAHNDATRSAERMRSRAAHNGGGSSSAGSSGHGRSSDALGYAMHKWNQRSADRVGSNSCARQSCSQTCSGSDQHSPARLSQTSSQRSPDLEVLVHSIRAPEHVPGGSSASAAGDSAQLESTEGSPGVPVVASAEGSSYAADATLPPLESASANQQAPSNSAEHLGTTTFTAAADPEQQRTAAAGGNDTSERGECDMMAPPQQLTESATMPLAAKSGVAEPGTQARQLADTLAGDAGPDTLARIQPPDSEPAVNAMVADTIAAQKEVQQLQHADTRRSHDSLSHSHDSQHDHSAPNFNDTQHDPSSLSGTQRHW